MDEIEYLEEYEDLILPTMSSHSTVTKSRANTNQLATMADDEDSSSIDQDIFESLFDDHSDDESVMQKKVPAKLSQRSERSSRISRVSMDSLDMLVKDLGEPLNATADQQTKPTSKPVPKSTNTKTIQSGGKVMPRATTTTPAATKAASTPSHIPKDNSKPPNKSDTTATKPTIDERNAKTKSVATVRPTVQQNSAQTGAKQTNSNANATSSSTSNRTPLNSTSGSKQDAKETSASVSSSSKNTTATTTAPSTALTSRKQVSGANSTAGSASSNNAVSSSKANDSAAAPPKRIIERSQTTIIKPEKPQMKDPAEDPLSLENVDNETDSDTDSFVYSDISADTFVSLSDVDDDDDDEDERQVIELSNDSNYDRVNLDKIRGSTPSPTVSDDYKSDKDDSPTKILSKRDDKSMEGSALEINANVVNKNFSTEQTIDNTGEATTSLQQTPETPTNNSKTKSKSVDKSPNVSDTLLERIDTVLSVTNSQENELAIEKHTDDGVKLKDDAETNIKKDEKSEAAVPGSAMECNNANVDANTADEGIQEPSKATTTMDMEMKETECQNEELNAEEEEGEDDDDEKMEDGEIDEEEKMEEEEIDEEEKMEDEDIEEEDKVEEGDIEEEEKVGEGDIEEEEKVGEGDIDEVDNMKEGDMDEVANNAAKVSNESPDTLPNTINEDIEPLAKESSGNVVESIDNANDNENVTNFKEAEDEDNSKPGVTSESTLPHKENDATSKLDENISKKNADEKNSEADKQSSNKKHDKKNPQQKAKSDERSEKNANKEIVNDDEQSAKISDIESAEKMDMEEKIEEGIELDQTNENNKDKNTSKSDEATAKISERKNSDNKDVDVKIKDGIKTVKGNDKNKDQETEDIEQRKPESQRNESQDDNTKAEIEKKDEQATSSRKAEEENLKNKNKLDEKSKKVAENITKQRKTETKRNVSQDEKKVEKKDERTTTTRNIQQSHDKKQLKLETPKKSDKLTNSGKKLQTPIKSRKTESKTEYDEEKKPTEKATNIIKKTNEQQDRDVKKGVRLIRRETVTKEVGIAKKDATKGKDPKIHESTAKRNTKVLGEEKTPSSRSKDHKPNDESHKVDNDTKQKPTTSTITEMEKTKSETHRKLKSSTIEENLGSRSRSQTPQAKNITKKLTEKARESAKPHTREEKKDETAINLNEESVNKNKNPDEDQSNLNENEVPKIATDNEKIIEKKLKLSQEQLPQENNEDNNLDDDQAEQNQSNEEKVNATLTPKHDKRIRGLVVSLKKTDLSKVLNEKLVRRKEESIADKLKSVSKDEKSNTDKVEDIATKEKDDVKNQEDSQVDKSAEEKKSKEPQSDTETSNLTTKHIEPSDKKRVSHRRAHKDEAETKKDDKNTEVSSDKATDDTVINKEKQVIEFKETEESTKYSNIVKVIKNESENASTSKVAEQKSTFAPNTRKGKAIESALDEKAMIGSADEKQAENLNETDKVSENTSKKHDTGVASENADKAKHRRGGDKALSKEKISEAETTDNKKDKNSCEAMEIVSHAETQKQNIELNESADKKLVASVETTEIKENSDKVVEKELTTAIKAESSDKTNNEKGEVETVVRNTRETRAKANAQSSLKKPANTVINEAGNGDADGAQAKKVDIKIYKKETEKTLNNKEEVKVACENPAKETDKLQDKKLEEDKVNERADKTQAKKAEANTSKEVVDKTLHKKVEIEDVTESKDKPQVKKAEAKTHKKGAAKSLDKKVEPEEVREGKDETQSNVVEAKISRKVESKSEAKAIIETTTTTTAVLEKVAETKTVATSDKKAETEKINENADEMEEKKTETKAEEENKEIPLDKKTETETGDDSAAERVTKRTLRDRKKLSLNKKSETAFANENANKNLGNKTEVETVTENIEKAQENESVVVPDKVGESTIENLGEKSVAAEGENKAEESKVNSESVSQSLDKELNAEKVVESIAAATTTKTATAESSTKTGKHVRPAVSKKTTRNTDNKAKTETTEDNKDAAVAPNEEQIVEIVKEIDEPEGDTKTVKKPENNTEDGTKPNEQEETVRQTPTPKENTECEKELVDVGGSGVEVTRSLRSRPLRQQTEAASSTLTQSTTPAHSTIGGEEEHEASTRRSLRKRGADQSPSNTNELAKKGLKVTPSTATTIAQKLTKDQSNINRSHTVTPTSALARKRVREIPPSTAAEVNDLDKSPLEKKTKVDSLRKSSRLHNDEVETSESEIETLAVQRRSRLSGIRDNPSNKSVRDSSTSLERKTVQAGAKQNADTEKNDASLGSGSPRKRENKSQTTAATATTHTTTDANKKRTKSAAEIIQPAKKVPRTNDNETTQQQQQQRQIVKQLTASTATMAEANETGDPLQLPTKRLRRLQAIDGYDSINAAEDAKADELDKNNTASAPKRKSLRAVAGGQNDTAKPLEAKQQQQQQQLNKIFGKKTENTVEAMKDNRSVETNRPTTAAAKGTPSALKTQIQTSATKSSPASKVLTFTEWLEQQKKNDEENGSEDAQVEGKATTTATAKTLTNIVKNVDAANLNIEKSKMIAAAASTTVSEVMRVIVGDEKELRQRAVGRDIRDANKRKDAIIPNSKAQNDTTTNEMSKSPTTGASRQIRTEKVPTTQFKRPPLPQKPLRSTPQRSGNRTPTPMQQINNSTTPQNGKQSALNKIDIKSKMRKLRVRINRSIVPEYFRKINLSLSRGQVKNDIEQKFSTATDTSSHGNGAKPQKPPLPITQKRVTLKSSIHTPNQQQLPTLTARPTVAAASSTNNTTRLGGTLPTLTKVPGAAERITTRPQDELNTSQNTAAGYQNNSAEELSLLTPMKSVAVPSSTSNSRSQQQQPKNQLASSAAESVREKRTSATSATDASNNSMRTQQVTGGATNSSNNSLAKDTSTAFTPVVPKEEIVDEQQQQQQQQQQPQTTQSLVRTASTAAAAADSSSVSSNSLASRTLAIAAATNSALNQQPPTNDPSGYYGLTPTPLDSNGTRLYSFLHPAKYNRNHGCVLLDYCCPNLDGPMPAIDPTRIHAQVQAGVRELPAYIVMTTKLITRADLEANKSVIPASIRQKVEKITADASAVINGTSNTNVLPSMPPTLSATAAAANSSLTPTITALQKHLPPTTSITPKLMPPSSSSTSAAAMSSSSTSLNNSLQRGGGTPTPNTSTTSQFQINDYQRSLLRTSVRQFDARLKKYYYRIALLSFSDRQKIIDNLITNTTLIPKDVESAVRLLDEYAAQISLLPIPLAIGGGGSTSKPGVTQAMQQSSTSKATITPTTNTVPVRTNTIQQQQQQQQQNQRTSNGQGAVLDKDNSLLGYQLTSTSSSAMALSKSTISTRSSIMSTGCKNTSMPNVSTASGGVLPALKSAQDSPRIFYTKQPMQTSTPIAATTSSGNTSMSGGKSISLRSAPRVGRDLTVRQMPSKLASVSSTSVTSTPPTTRRLPQLTRNPHLSTSNTTPNSSAAETITTRSAVTISTAPKRMTRASAAAKVIVITQNNEGTTTPSDECILPDGHNSAEIKREKIDDDFVGGN